MRSVIGGDKMAVTKVFADREYVSAIINDSAIPIMAQVTLATANWDDTAKSQTVAIAGVLADTTAQYIQINPIPASMHYAIEAGVYCSAQADGVLTFSCSVIPVEDIVVNVILQNVNYIS